MPQNIGMKPINMLERVIAELDARTGDLRKVATDTGIPYDTILRVKNRENDPAFSRVAALYAYLFPQTFTRPDGRVVADERQNNRRAGERAI